MEQEECVFCQISKGELSSKKILENEEFLAIENKYPQAPVHILVIPKDHISKKELVEKNSDTSFWGGMMKMVFEIVKAKGLDKMGYKLVNNGAGYNHFDHEHMHVMGGSDKLKE